MSGAFNRQAFPPERMIALGSLLVVAAFAWMYLWYEAAHMPSMPMGSPGEAAGVARAAGSQVRGTAWLLPTLAMWTIMMIAMMLPSAAPAILLYGSIAKKNRERGSPLAPLWIFTAGYLAVWTGFSALATVLQAVLQVNDLVNPMMVSDSNQLSGALLIVAGLYQWLPAKDACLQKCRHPLQFFLFRWRPRAGGAFVMGVEHGAFCAGCCWALMLLLFTAGVMNLLWVVAIAAYVLVEKLASAGRRIGRITGGALAAAGIILIA